MRETTTTNISTNQSIREHLNGKTNVSILKNVIINMNQRFNNVRRAGESVDGVMSLLVSAYNETYGREILSQFYDCVGDKYYACFYDRTQRIPYGRLVEVNKFIDDIEEWIELNTMLE